MKRQNLFVRISLILTLLLLVAAVMVGCGEKDETTVAGTGVSDAVEKIGEGQYTFMFAAVMADGSIKSYEVSTDEETLGDALLKLDLIGGEESQYGLTVYTVCGEEHDFNKSASYWALYVDGEYGMVGVDSINCKDVKNVEFRVEK